MPCRCIRDTYDFDLIYTSCKDITYRDRSTWQEGVGFDPNISYTLVITLPGGATQTHQVFVGQELPLNFGNCPEPGIYKFSVNSCTEEFHKYFPILCTLECGYLRAVAKLGKGIDVKGLRSIRERIEHIKDLVSYGDIVSSQDLVDTVERDLSKINCECSCS